MLAKKLGRVTEYPGSGAQNTQSQVSEASIFDPIMPIDTPVVSLADKPQEEEFLLTSIFEENENLGPKVSEVIAQRINDACSKKVVESKLKELQEE